MILTRLRRRRMSENVTTRDKVETSRCGGDAGFTLVELLVVLAIIALIGTLVGPRVLGYIGTAKSDTAATQIRNLSNAVELFYLDVGAYPDDEAQLKALLEPLSAAGWNGPYLKTAASLIDPWGRTYRYKSADGQFVISTLGRDDKPGGTGEDADLLSDTR